MFNSTELSKVNVPLGCYENDKPECFSAHVDRSWPVEMLEYDECHVIGHKVSGNRQFVWVEKFDPMKRPTKRRVGRRTGTRAKIDPVYTITRWESFGWTREWDVLYKGAL